MGGTTKSAVLAVVGVLAVPAVGACGRLDALLAADPVVSATPTPSPKPSRTPTTVAKTPLAVQTFDLTDAVVQSKLYKAGKVPAVRCVPPRPNLNTKAGMLAYAKVLETLQVYGELLEDFEYRAYAGDNPGRYRRYGSSKTNTAWATAAFKAKSPGACNTWAASSARVS